MSSHSIVLAIHIAAGSLGLILGPVAMFVGKRRGAHTRTGEAYHWVFVVLVCTAVVLAVWNWHEGWWLALVGAGSYAFALLGYLSAKRRRPGWLPVHVAGQGGSYIAMVTALLVVNLGTASPLAWIAPTLIGTPIIAWVSFQIGAGRRPKQSRRLAKA